MKLTVRLCLLVYFLCLVINACYRNSPVAAKPSSSTTASYKQYQVQTAAVDLDITLNASAGIAVGKRSSSNNHSNTNNMNNSNSSKVSGSNSNENSSSTVPRSLLLQQYGSQIESNDTPASYIAVLLTAQSLYTWSRLKAHMQALLLNYFGNQANEHKACLRLYSAHVHYTLLQFSLHIT
jgi:hypothetical protein